jgi:hypothetical protein
MVFVNVLMPTRGNRDEKEGDQHPAIRLYQPHDSLTKMLHTSHTILQNSRASPSCPPTQALPLLALPHL